MLFKKDKQCNKQCEQWKQYRQCKHFKDCKQCDQSKQYQQFIAPCRLFSHGIFFISGLIIFVLFLYSSQTIGAAQWFYSIKDHFLSAASNPLRTTLGYDRLSGNMLGEKLKQNFLFLLTFKFFHNFIFEINWNLPCCFDLLFVMRPFAELTNLNNIAEPNLNFILISSV